MLSDVNSPLLPASDLSQHLGSGHWLTALSCDCVGRCYPCEGPWATECALVSCPVGILGYWAQQWAGVITQWHYVVTCPSRPPSELSDKTPKNNRPCDVLGPAILVRSQMFRIFFTSLLFTGFICNFYSAGHTLMVGLISSHKCTQKENW